ncbi:MAG: clan AA aspartic protease [Elusimicrobia bacterium]|nr:clan AA aspartic protease [Elusimicrobiota bacterium]
MSRLALPSLVVLLASTSLLSRADTVFLRNGNTMEGLVLRESAQELELDIGYGTVVLQKDDIRRVKRSSAREREALKKKRREQAIDSGGWTPAGAQMLSSQFRELRTRREEALDAKARKELLLAQQAALEGKVAAAKRDYAPAAQRLRSLNPRNVSYNDAVHELNVLTSAITAGELKLEEDRRKIRDLQDEIGAYGAAYDDFDRLLKSDARFSGRRRMGKDEKAFYERIRKSVKKMGGDFSQESVASRRRGPHVVVEALLDGRVKALLLVDTGASLSVISQRLADKLKPSPQSLRGNVEVTVADGRKVTAQALVLESVAIGRMSAARVNAAVMPDFDDDADGLLGMSFLERFDVQVDPKRNRLTLRELK